MQSEATFKKLEKLLFKDAAEAEPYLTPREQEVRKRMMLCVSIKMEKPLTPDSEIVNFLMGGCGGQCAKVQKSQAYRDIGTLNRLLGNIQLASKQWYRYMIVEGAKEAFALAIENNDAKGASAALDKLGKYTRCDKNDDTIDYSEMLPPSFEPTDDVTILEGIEPIADLEKKRQELRSFFHGKVIEDAKIVLENEDDHGE